MTEKTVTTRKKPKFVRTDAHKKIRFGKGVRKNQKWRHAKGRHNKIRLGIRGKAQRPKIGWGAPADSRNLIEGLEVVRVENFKQLDEIKKGQGIIVASVGMKKKAEIIKLANEKKITILNKYKKLPEASGKK